MRRELEKGQTFIMQLVMKIWLLWIRLWLDTGFKPNLLVLNLRQRCHTQGVAV